MKIDNILLDKLTAIFPIFPKNVEKRIKFGIFVG